MNSTWENIWWLAKQELKMVRMGYLWNFLYAMNALFVITIFGGTGSGMLVSGDSHLFLITVFNFFLLTVIQVFGYSFDSRYMNYWKKDSYTKRVVLLKMLPVTNREIILSRYVSYLLYGATYIVLLFAGIKVCMAFGLIESVSWGTWTGMLVTWYSTVLFAGAFYLYGEMSMRGRSFFKMGFVLNGLAPLISIALSVTGGFLVWSIVINRVKEDGALLPVLSFLTGAFTLYLSWKQLEKKMANRDFYSS
ncbi:hypothetical protein [Paenibacillus sp. FJAT-26967]|uniref:hypothetical protein n=1 Tax=Paenibacillus sp. FJAT-26967 TaxID=1729690 RepID=UPI000837EDF8|nr:hypothetical protein [Paenibacillus sp. FJAT-26967]